MGRIKVVSFDMEGTLIDHTFSNLIWETDIPSLYALRYGLSFEIARQRVLDEYRQVGEEKKEWYDLDYWFKRLGLDGNWHELPERRRDDCIAYPETSDVLKRLSKRYNLIIASNTIREFLDVQLRKLPSVFTHVFSATSDFNIVKKSEEFYSRICNIMGVLPCHIAHVGDNRRFDFEAAHQLGIHAYHLDRTGESEDEYVVQDLVEFESRIRELEDGFRH